MAEAEPFPPPGSTAFYLSDSSLARLGMKTGDGIDDFVENIELTTEAVVNDIKTQFSDFNDHREMIFRWSEGTLLLVRAPRDQFDWNYIWFNTPESIANWKAKFNEAKEKEAEAAAGSGEGQDEQEIEAAVEEVLDVEYEQKFFSPRDRDDFMTSWKEIEDMTVVNPRTLGFRINRRRGGFLQPIHPPFQSNELEKPPAAPGTKEADFELKRLVADNGFQGAAQVSDLATQTTFQSYTNKSTTYQAVDLSEEQKELIMNSDTMSTFLADAYERCRPALQMNETVDIFKDEFEVFENEEVSVGNRVENNLNAAHSFHYDEFCKNKQITAIQWHPKRRGLVIFAATNNLDFDDWVQKSGEVLSSSILIWNFQDLLKPQFVLDVPGELTCFKINPEDENIVIGGLLTGQVLFWDLKEAYQALEDQKTAKNAQQNSRESQMDSRTMKRDDTGLDEVNERKLLVDPVKHSVMSHIDRSHAQRICDMAWLDPTMKVEPRKGTIREVDEIVSTQFITISIDGHVFVWDADVSKMQTVVMQAHESYRNRGKQASTVSEIKWTPIFTVGLANPRTTLNMAGTALALSSGTLLQAGTEDGDLIFVDFAAKAKEALLEHEAGTEKKELPVVSAVVQGHLQHIFGVQVSPHFPDMILTVADWSFFVWKNGLSEPVFRSPTADDYVACAQWSPTRPGVIMVGRSNGCIDVWDLLDQCHKPSMQVSCGSEARLVSMQFWTSSNIDQNFQIQRLAVGDVSGKLHVLDVPRNLLKPIKGETELMRKFYAREIRRVEYHKMREETVHAKKRKEHENKMSTPVLDNDHFQHERKDAEAKEAQEIAANEIKYKEMLTKFQEQLAAINLKAQNAAALAAAVAAAGD